jgi:hypothetical protein
MEAAKTEEHLERVFATGDHCELSLVNVRGAIKVVGWDKPEVAVSAIKRLGNYMGAQQAFDETIVMMEQEGPVVSLRTRMARGFSPFAWLGLGTTPPEVDYMVQVPTTSEVAVRTVSGPVEITGIQGAVYVRSVNGDLYLQDVSGNAMVHTVNGRFSGQELAGNLGATFLSNRPWTRVEPTRPRPSAVVFTCLCPPIPAPASNWPAPAGRSSAS